ncbi:MAG TPA: hypothetical protein VFU21_09730 [Kofleriaceae bacterium]|nr:hypothetical protein [Kofleriaceae bacterium]
MARGIAIAAALVAAVGCKGDELPAGKVTPEVRALLAHVPGDSKLAAGIDLALARSSGLWDEAMADAVPKLIAVGHQCGTNLMTEIDRVVVSAADVQPAVDRIHFVVAGRFTPSGKSCLNEIVALRHATATWKEGIAIVTPAGRSPDASAVTAAPDMLARIAKADTSGVVWIAADTRGAAGGARMPLPAELHGVALSVRPQGDGVAAVARLQVDSEDRAKATADLFRGQKDGFKKALPDPKLGEILGRIQVSQVGPEVAFQVAVSKAELQHLYGLRAMLGAP